MNLHFYQPSDTTANCFKGVVRDDDKDDDDAGFENYILTNNVTKTSTFPFEAVMSASLFLFFIHGIRKTHFLGQEA